MGGIIFWLMKVRNSGLLSAKFLCYFMAHEYWLRAYLSNSGYLKKSL